MAAIKNELEAIKSARFGEEVRWAFHDGLFKMNDQIVNAENSTIKNATSALNSANNSAKSAKEAEESATNAKRSEELAKEYMGKTLTATPDGYNANMELLANMDIKTTTSPTLYNSKDGGVRLNHMVCRTEQEQYSGKNIIGYGTSTGAGDYSLQPQIKYEKNGITAIRNADDSVTLTGTTTEDNTFFNLNYYNNTTNFAEPNDYILNGGSTLVRTQVIVDSTLYTSTGEDKIFTIPENTTKSWVRVHIDKAGTTVNKTVYPMVRLATVEDGTYEPFVGNAPSPSPNFPQSLNHTGDCVEMVQGYYDVSNHLNIANSSSYIVTKNAIPCKEGDIVKIECERDVDGSLIYWLDSNRKLMSSSTTENSNNKLHEAVVPNGVNMFYFRIRNLNGITPETVGKISLTVNDKYVHQICETGKNLFDVSKILDGYFENKNLRFSAKVAEFYRYSFKEETQYTFSGYFRNILHPDNTKLGNIRFRIKYSDGTIDEKIFENQTTDFTYRTFTSESNKTIVYFGITFGSNGFMEIKGGELQIEEGDTATAYKPYTEHIATFYTEQPTREGDRFVQVDGLWNVERNVRTAQLSKNDNIVLYTDNKTSNGVMFVNKMSLTENRVDAFFSHGAIKKSFGYGEHGLVAGNNDATLYWLGVLDNLGISTIDEFKTWLDGKEAIVEYKTATPTYEILDTASQIALNSLKSFNGCTYIEVDSRVQPSEISFDYGTSRVGAMALQATNDNLIKDIKIQELEERCNELAVAIVALGSGV